MQIFLPRNSKYFQVFGIFLQIVLSRGTQYGGIQTPFWKNYDVKLNPPTLNYGDRSTFRVVDGKKLGKED